MLPNVHLKVLELLGIPIHATESIPDQVPRPEVWPEFRWGEADNARRVTDLPPLPLLDCAAAAAAVPLPGVELMRSVPSGTE